MTPPKNRPIHDWTTEHDHEMIVATPVLQDHLAKLMRAGFDRRAIADALDIPITDLVEYDSQPLHPAQDEEINTGVRVIAQRALEEALYVYEYGSARDRVAMTRAVLTPMIRALSQNAGVDKELADMKRRFTTLLEGMHPRGTDGPGSRALDQDEAGRDRAVSS